MGSRFLPFHRPDVDQGDIDAIVRTLRSGWITSGPRVREFESAFAERVGSRYAVALNSGTAALHLALEAVGIKEGDEILVPTMTFAATAEVTHHFNAKPVFVDCRPDTLNIDVTQMERLVTRRTRAILPVHFAGQPCDMDEIVAFAKEFKLHVVEDAAHAFPASYRGRTIGGIGDITCFSFHATKTLTTGEGGMATTDNPRYERRMRLMRLHGISRDSWARRSGKGQWHYEILRPGFKYNMTDIAASMGIRQLRRSEALWERRRGLARRYDDGLRHLEEIIRPAVAKDLRHAWHLYVIQLDLKRLRISRNEFVERLKGRGIETGIHFMPLHLHRYYREAFGCRPGDYPNATEAFRRIISLPLFPAMAFSDVDRVVRAIERIVRATRK